MARDLSGDLPAHCSRAVVWAPAVALLAAAAVAIVGCGGNSTAGASSVPAQRAALIAYLRQVDPLRLAVNRLLEGADPILAAYRRAQLSSTRAARQMEALERRFAGYTVDIAAIDPTGARLHSLHATYAHTYVLEDSYLSALATGLAERKLGDLPDTQAEQRAAIIEWRTGVTVLARRLSVELPGNLQAAGRGEVAPSPGGS